MLEGRRRIHPYLPGLHGGEEGGNEGVNKVEYLALKARIENEYREKIKALEIVWGMISSEPLPSQPKGKFNTDKYSKEELEAPYLVFLHYSGIWKLLSIKVKYYLVQ